MMTPQEVASHVFAKATFGGYNMTMVDEFLDQLTEDYTALYNDNTILKNKLKVLSDSIEEYRATDVAMRKTLLAAQQMADSMVSDAEKKKTQLEQDATQEAQARKSKLEAEIAELDGEEKAMFLEDLGIAQSGLDRLINASYTLLGLISYLTAGEDECRAWTIVNGTKAPQAAGKIHSDFERGFIRAETVAFEDLKACGSMAAAREKGLIRSEGKDYVVKDGDIILFRFNV